MPSITKVKGTEKLGRLNLNNEVEWVDRYTVTPYESLETLVIHVIVGQGRKTFMPTDPLNTSAVEGEAFESISAALDYAALVSDREVEIVVAAGDYQEAWDFKGIDFSHITIKGALSLVPFASVNTWIKDFRVRRDLTPTEMRSRLLTRVTDIYYFLYCELPRFEGLLIDLGGKSGKVRESRISGCNNTIPSDLFFVDDHPDRTLIDGYSLAIINSSKVKGNNLVSIGQKPFGTLANCEVDVSGSTYFDGSRVPKDKPYASAAYGVGVGANSSLNFKSDDRNKFAVFKNCTLDIGTNGKVFLKRFATMVFDSTELEYLTDGTTINTGARTGVRGRSGAKFTCESQATTLFHGCSRQLDFADNSSFTISFCAVNSVYSRIAFRLENSDGIFNNNFNINDSDIETIFSCQQRSSVKHKGTFINSGKLSKNRTIKMECTGGSTISLHKKFHYKKVNGFKRRDKYNPRLVGADSKPDAKGNRIFNRA